MTPTKTARIAPITLVLILVGCNPQKPPPSPEPSPAPPAPAAPPATTLPPTPEAPLPSPPDSHSKRTSRISVPENTRNPVLVKKGVSEWLSAHPDYAGPLKVAVLERMRKESSFQPCAHSGPYHHLLQWGRSRLAELHKFTNTKPGQCPSWLAQMRFMDFEIKSEARYAEFFDSTPKNAYRVFTVAYLGGKP